MKVLGNRLLIKPHEVTSQGGIILTQAIRTKADVVAVGRGYYVDGKWEPMDVKKGDVIYFQGGIEIEKGILVISEKDVLAVMEKEKKSNTSKKIRHF
jgi:co-chaperonin GroES (HSP10)